MFKNQSLQIQLTIQCAQLNAGDSKGCVGNDQHIVVFFQQYACDVHLLPMASLVPKINESNIFCSTKISQRCIISLKLLPGSWLFCKLGPGGLVAGPTTNSDTWARYQWQFKAVSKIYIKKKHFKLFVIKTTKTLIVAFMFSLIYSTYFCSSAFLLLGFLLPSASDIFRCTNISCLPQPTDKLAQFWWSTSTVLSGHIGQFGHHGESLKSVRFEGQIRY